MENTRINITEIQKLELEMAVYLAADHFWNGYQGGSWSFCEEGNYWYPHEAEVELCNMMNYFEGVLSSRVAGIALSMFAANQLCWKFHSKGIESGTEYWGEYYYSLRSWLLSNFTDQEQTQVMLFLD